MTQIPAYQYDEVVADNGRLLGEIAALSRELEVARECHVEKLERALKAEAEVERLRDLLNRSLSHFEWYEGHGYSSQRALASEIRAALGSE